MKEKFKNAQEVEKEFAEKEKEIKQRVKDREISAEEGRKEMEKLEQRFQDYFKVFILFILSISLFYAMMFNPAIVMAEEEIPEPGQPPPISGELKEPDTFEEAMQLAEDMKNFALEWREKAYFWENKYNKEHSDFLELQKTLENVTELKNTYKEWFEESLNKKDGGFNISGGVDFKPLKPEYTGLMLEIGYQF